MLFVYTGHANFDFKILIDVQYLQKATFSFEKGSNGQNNSSSGSTCLVKKIFDSLHWGKFPLTP